MLKFCDFIQVYVFTTNHHGLNEFHSDGLIHFAIKILSIYSLYHTCKSEHNINIDKSELC